VIRTHHVPLAVVLGVLIALPSDTACTRRASAASPREASLVVHCDVAGHPISELVYGISSQSMDEKSGQWELAATGRRWGGNHTSRYNWRQGNATNKGKDWFFKNADYGGTRTPAYERFIDDDRTRGLSTTITVPTIGWVAKDTTSYGFPVSVYGAQGSTEPGYADVGNGVTPSGALVAARDNGRTSVPMSPADIGEWVRAIRTRGVHSYILDNEPMLWNETHRDVHPEPVSYDELLQRTIAYAGEIRRADPNAIIAGPALWGWDACLHSAVDKNARRTQPDRAAHGGMALLPWWLREVRAQENRTGVKLVDLVDVHFYPQGKGMGLGTDGSTDADTAARRIRSTRALWDPTYVDESWIAEPVSLVPHIRTWIAENAPGLGISIGEYNFGAEGHMSGGLAVAEALGRFGALGVASAYYWDVPERYSAAFWAFRAYRNFDGAGGRFLDESIAADSSNPATSIFASRNGEHMVLVLLNFDPATAITPHLDLASCGRVVSKKAYIHSGSATGFAPSDAASLPPYSITVVDLAVAR
jgi:hypothetical protein